MSLRARLNDDLKTAMRAKDERGVGTLRLVLAALKDRDIAARPKGVTAVPEDEILQMMNGMIKQRRDSIALYQQGGRPELAAREQEEIDIIQRYLPKQLDDAAVVEAVKTTIAAVGAGGMKDMGKVMAALKEQYAGQMDFSRVSAIVKQQLGS
jgi:uncharacterized protein YqeY